MMDKYNTVNKEKNFIGFFWLGVINVKKKNNFDLTTLVLQCCCFAALSACGSVHLATVNWLESKLAAFQRWSWSAFFAHPRQRGPPHKGKDQSENNHCENTSVIRRCIWTPSHLFPWQVD